MPPPSPDKVAYDIRSRPYTSSRRRINCKGRSWFRPSYIPFSVESLTTKMQFGRHYTSDGLSNPLQPFPKTPNPLLRIFLAKFSAWNRPATYPFSGFFPTPQVAGVDRTSFSRTGHAPNPSPYRPRGKHRRRQLDTDSTPYIGLARHHLPAPDSPCFPPEGWAEGGVWRQSTAVVSTRRPREENGT